MGHRDKILGAAHWVINHESRQTCPHCDEVLFTADTVQNALAKGTLEFMKDVDDGRAFIRELERETGVEEGGWRTIEAEGGITTRSNDFECSYCNEEIRFDERFEIVG
jgi:transcription initiation factor IIE alpha subunit